MTKFEIKKHGQTETRKQCFDDVEPPKPSESDSRKPLATESKTESGRPESMEPETGLRMKEYPPEAKSEIRKHGQTETRKQGLYDVEQPKPSEPDRTTRKPHLSETETVARVPRQIAVQNQNPSEIQGEPRSSTIGKVEQKECKAGKDDVIEKDTILDREKEPSMGLANEPSKRGAPSTVKTRAGISNLVSSGADADANKLRATETGGSLKKPDLVEITAEGGKSSPADKKSIASKPEGPKAKFTGTKPVETDKEPKSRIQSSTETKGVDRKPLSTEPESKSRKTDQLSMKEESRKPGPYEIVGELKSLKKIIFHHAMFIHLHTNG